MNQHADIKDLILYNPDTGIFTWKAKRRGVVSGKECGRLSVHGYREIGLFGKLHRAHRLAFLYMTGSMPESDVDHINMVKDDNRWSNLRLCTKSENMQNTTAKKNNTSGKKGVTWDKDRGLWRAQARVNGVKKNLGRFADIEKAHEAVIMAYKSEFYRG